MFERQEKNKKQEHTNVKIVKELDSDFDFPLHKTT